MPPGGRGSGWITYELTNEFQDYSFDFTPNLPNPEGNQYVGIWPDVKGRGRTMDVKWVKVEIVTPQL